MDLIGNMKLVATGPLKTGIHSTNIYARLGKKALIVIVRTIYMMMPFI